MLYRQWKLSMGKADFQGSADSKPLDRSTQNLEPITTVLTSCYIPTLIIIAPRVRLPNMVKLHILCNPSFSFFSLLVTSHLRNAPVDSPSLCLKRRRLPQGSAFWGSHRRKNFFTGEYPFPRIFKGHFTCKSKKSNNF
jgi:hypothetical protein